MKKFFCRYLKFAQRIAHINWHEREEKDNTIVALEEAIEAENINYQETLEVVPLSIRESVHIEYRTRIYFIEKLIELIRNLPVASHPLERTEIVENRQD